MTNNTSNITSLNQGAAFLDKQKKLKKKSFATAQNAIKISSSSLPQPPNTFNIVGVTNKEGFDVNPNVPLANASNKTYENTALIDYEIHQLDDLKVRYNAAIDDYNSYLAVSGDTAMQYVARTSPSNQYRNTNITLSNGNSGYVTNQGVYKPYTNSTIQAEVPGKNGCPANFTNVNVDGSTSTTAGTTIATTPALLVGSEMQYNQSCGSEGQNVYVNSILPENIPATQYLGVFQDNALSPRMEFLGSSPPINYIQNGNFDSPQIQSDSYVCYSQVDHWNNGACLINNSSAWWYPIPYPAGNQAISIQKNASISQSVTLLDTGYYILYFYAVNRPYISGSQNLLNFYIDGSIIINNMSFTSNWAYYGMYIYVTAGTHTITFTGTVTTIDCSIAIQGISLLSSLQLYNYPSYTFDQCKTAAISKGYRYFGLQGGNSSSNMAYCGVSPDYVIPTQLGTAFVPNTTPVYLCGLVGTNVWGPCSDFPDRTASWIWYTPNSAAGAPVTEVAVPMTYNFNYTGSTYVNVTIYIIIDDIMQIMSIGSQTTPTPVISYGWNNNTNKVPDVNISPGLNVIQCIVVNTGGPAGLLMTAIDNASGAVIFNTNADWVFQSGPPNVENTVTLSDGTTSGGLVANAIYDIGAAGIPGYVGKVGYVDQNSNLSEYPADMITIPYDSGTPGLLVNYNLVPSPSPVISGVTLKACQDSCTNNPDCKSIMFTDNYQQCMLLTNDSTNTSSFSEYLDYKTYFNNGTPTITNSSSMCPTGTTTIDSVQWANYVNSGTMMTPTTDCTGGQLTLSRDAKLMALQNKVGVLSSQVSNEKPICLICQCKRGD